MLSLWWSFMLWSICLERKLS